MLFVLVPHAHSEQAGRPIEGWPDDAGPETSPTGTHLASSASAKLHGSDKLSPMESHISDEILLKRERYASYFITVLFFLYSSFFLLSLAFSFIDTAKIDGKVVRIFIVLVSVDSYLFIIISFFLPAAFAVMHRFDTVFHPQFYSSNGLQARFIYYLIISVLLVLLTLDISHLFQIQNRRSFWYPMLIAASVLDIVSLTFFLLVIGDPILKSRWPVSSESTVEIIFLMGIASFVSSVFTILCARAKEKHLRDQETP